MDTQEQGDKKGGMDRKHKTDLTGLHLHCREMGTFKAMQLLTGHGNLAAYLHRFRLKYMDGRCLCGQGMEDQ